MLPKTHLPYLALCAALTWALPAAAGNDSWAEARQAFREAYARVQSGQPDRHDPRALRHYILYPYLQAARLRRDLQGTPDKHIDRNADAFLRAHESEPVARGLRADWLLSLARRERWQDYLAQFPAGSDDPLLNCYALKARLATGRTQHLRDDALAQWLVGHDMPAVCDDAFDWLEEQGAITPERIESRAHLALESGQTRLARYLIQRLPQDRREPLATWARLQDDSEDELSRLAREPEAPAEPTWIEDAFWQLARRDSDAAADVYDKLISARALPEDTKTRLLRSLALGLAYDHKPEAVARFAHLPDDAADDAARGWRVRAALLSGDWARALDWIKRMPDELRAQPEWRYWCARALEQTGRVNDAVAAYDAAAQAREYYGFLAAERLGREPDLKPAKLDDDAKVQSALLAQPAVLRARELFLADLRDEAAVEWRTVVAPLDAAAKAQAARLAASWGWHDQTILTLAQADSWDDLGLRFPLPYATELTRASRQTGISIARLYSMMRAESLFNPKAESPSAALGLLQLKIATARHAAYRLERPPPSRDQLFRPGINLLLGAAYLHEMLERFQNRFILAAAAYNAGPDHVMAWLPKDPVPADVWIENIPYDETRTYVRRALYNLVIYGWRLDGRPADLTPLMAPVPPPVPSPARGGGPGRGQQ